MDNTTLPQSSHTPDEGEKPRQFIRIGNVKIDLGDAISAILQSAGTVLTDIRTVEFCQEVPAGELSVNFSMTRAVSMLIPTLALIWS